MKRLVLRVLARFSVDEQVRALRASNDRLSSLLAESYAARTLLNAANEFLAAELTRAGQERDQKIAEIAMLIGADSRNGQSIGRA